MPYRDLDFTLTDEEKSIRDTIRKFGAEVMRPAGIELDKLADPADVIAEGSVLWDVFKKYRELDFHKRNLPKAVGGMAEEVSPMASFLIGEEMGYADAGLAISLGVSSMPFAYCALSPDPELKSWAMDFAEDYDCKMIGCWAITEPDHGGDWSLGGDDPKCGPSVKAVLKGDEYIINGQKAAWVSNGTIATHAVLHVSLDPSRGMYGQGIAIIRLDLPGISKGAPLNKIGQRALNQGEIFFEEVKIPKNWMVLTPDPARPRVEGALSGPNGSMAVVFGGLAKAAFDEAQQYSKERIQGGKPICEHQNVQLKLFKMFKMVESARALSRRMAMYNANNMPPSDAHAVASKWMSTETAFRVASEAIQIFGGNGLSKEYVIEKIFRDARAAMIEDGVNETLALSAMEYLM